jgi:zinc protease
MSMQVRGWGAWIVILGVFAATGCSPRGRLHYGSLHPDDRHVDYRPEVAWFSLPNGLTVVLAPDDRANLVTVDVRYLVGAAEDPAGKPGLAHLVEHMMFEQRAEPAGATLADRLTGATLSFNANTTWDTTHYSEIALPANLDQLLSIEATRMAVGCHGIDQPTFDRERAVVIQEGMQRGAADRVAAMRGALFGASHPYTRSLGGHDVADLTLADVCGFVDAFYAPDRAILVVGGRVDVEPLRASITRRFGPLHRHASRSRTPIPPVVLTGGSSELSGDDETASALVFFPAGLWGTAEAIEDDLLDGVVAQRLAGLEERERWVTDVEVGRLGGRRTGARYFAISVADPARLDDAVAQIFRIVDDLTRADISVVLGTLRSRRQAELLSGFESIEDRGSWCADYLQFTRHGELHVHELQALGGIDVERLHARARRLTRGTSHVFRILPNKDRTRTREPQLREAAARIDLPVWHAMVDPAEADRPIALPAELPARAFSEFRLSNGLRVVMAGNFTQPVFEARLVFPVGTAGIGAKRAVVAKAAAALLGHDFEGEYSAKEAFILEWVLRLGAGISPRVTDHTVFQIQGASIFADWHLWRLYWLLHSGIYNETEVSRLQATAARAARRRDPGDHRGWRRALREALFGRDHPYAQDDDPLARVAGLDVDDLYAFRDTYYRTNGATLLIVGRFDAVMMQKTVRELFGDWSGEPPPATPPVPVMRPAVGPTWIAHADPEASQVRITYGFAATSPRASSRAARTIVAEMVHNRLQQIRTRLGASYGLDSGYDLTDAGDLLVVDGRVDPLRAGEVVRSMQADLDGLRAGDDSFAADFVRARRTALARALADPSQSSTEADRLEAAVTNHLALDAAAALPAEIARTTLAQVRAVITSDLEPKRMVVLLSGRPADTAAALATAGVTQVRTVTEP